jgi:hypothetical protein
MKLIKLTVISLCLALWPINLFLANTLPGFLSYIVPALLFLLSFFLYKKYPKYYLLPILFIGIFEKKLLLLPVVFYGLEMIMGFDRKKLVLFMVSLVLLVVYFPSFRGQTVFTRDYQAEQLVLRNIELYPDVITARIFQNKPRIYINKLSDNFFALTDLNNYFFGLHPRPIVIDNQNLFKMPFVAIVFFLYGAFYISRSKDKKFILISIASCLVSLTLLKNFDRNDFVLWLPISLIIIYGINRLSLKNQKLFNIISVIFIFFAIPEVIRGFAWKNLLKI